MKSITLLEFNDRDMKLGAEIAGRLGRKEDWTYNSTSDMPGMGVNGKDGRRYMICKTKEFGFLVISDLTDMGFEEFALCGGNI